MHDLLVPLDRLNGLPRGGDDDSSNSCDTRVKRELAVIYTNLACTTGTLMTTREFCGNIHTGYV